MANRKRIRRFLSLFSVLLIAGCTCSSDLYSLMKKEKREIHSKWELWAGATELRGANLWQKVIDPKRDGTSLGPGSVGPPYSEQDFQHLAALGANYVNLSHPGLFTETPPYRLVPEVQQNLDQLLDKIEKANLFAVVSFRTGPGRSEDTFDDATHKHPTQVVWKNNAARIAWGEMWKVTAARYRGNTVVAGYDLMVEPNANELVKADQPSAFYEKYRNTGMDWAPMAKAITQKIREVDSDTPLIVGAMNYSGVGWLSSLEPTGDSKTVYAVHQYEPYDYTHSAPGAKNQKYPDPQGFNRNSFKDLLAPVEAFRKKTGAPVTINEFGVMRWVPGAAPFLDDEMKEFERLGLNYAYWLWESSWPSISYDQFNLLHGIDPTQHKEQLPNPLVDTLKKYWAKNELHPSALVPQLASPTSLPAPKIGK
jgi:hypothetical protein